GVQGAHASMQLITSLHPLKTEPPPNEGSGASLWQLSRGQEKRIKALASERDGDRARGGQEQETEGGGEPLSKLRCGGEGRRCGTVWSIDTPRLSEHPAAGPPPPRAANSRSSGKPAQRRGKRRRGKRRRGKQAGREGSMTQSQAVVDDWVQCDKCFKWRRGVAGVSSEEFWECSLSSDSSRNRCSAPEERARNTVTYWKVCTIMGFKLEQQDVYKPSQLSSGRAGPGHSG
ncbi:MAG: hypothetical protein SGPRY_006624, partial [Prymnesium sp.]